MNLNSIERERESKPIDNLHSIVNKIGFCVCVENLMANPIQTFQIAGNIQLCISEKIISRWISSVEDRDLLSSILLCQLFEVNLHLWNVYVFMTALENCCCWRWKNERASERKKEEKEQQQQVNEFREWVGHSFSISFSSDTINKIQVNN